MVMGMISILIKNYIEILFFDTLFEAKKSRNSLKFYIYFLAISFSFGTFILFFNLDTLVSSFVSLLVISSFSFFYVGKIAQKILYTVVLIFLIAVTEFLSGLILLTLNIPIETFLSNNLFIAIQISLTSLLLFLCVLIIRIIKKRDISIADNVLLVFYPLTSIILIYLFHWILTNNLKEILSYSIFICASILILLSNVIIIYLIKTMINNELKEQRLTFTEELFSMKKQHQNDLVQLQENTNRIRHDLKSNLTHISGLLNAEKYSECKMLLNSLLKSTSDLEHVINTGYDGLDAVLSSKIITAKSKNILVNHIVSLPPKKFMFVNDIDISMICANILDNAIEAAEKSNQENATIEFNISYDSTLSHIQIYCKNPTINQSLPIKTTKADKENHGFGLKIIKELSQKWNGMMQYDINDNIFTLIVILYNHKI